jgi:uncharacterized protein (DUF433 family)
MASTIQPPAVDREFILPNSPMAEFISVNPARLHGEPVFRGTRVPVQALFDHLRAGDSFEKFLLGFPNVTREQVIGVIDLASHGILDGLHQS